MPLRFRKYSILISLAVLSALSVSAYSSITAEPFEFTACCLYQAHAENFCCLGSPTDWNQLLRADECEVTSLGAIEVFARPQNVRPDGSPFLDVGRYERNWYYETDLINAP